MSQDRRKNIFVGGISATLTEGQIQCHFAQYCTVAKVRIMKEKKTLVPKGFAFVSLEFPEEIQKVLDKQHVIQGRKVDVQLASTKGEKKDWKEEQKSKRIFVSNLPIGISNNELASHFTKYSEVRIAYIIKDFATDQTKNYGYVEFKDTGVPEKVMAETVVIDECIITCLPYIGRHEPKPKNATKSIKDTDLLSTEYFFTKKENSKCSQKINQINEVEPTGSDPINNDVGQFKTKPKYEYIGLSPMLNQDESNYSFNYVRDKKCRHSGLSFEPNVRYQIMTRESQSINNEGPNALYKKLKSFKQRESCQAQKNSNSFIVQSSAALIASQALRQIANLESKSNQKAYCYFNF